MRIKQETEARTFRRLSGGHVAHRAWSPPGRKVPSTGRAPPPREPCELGDKAWGVSTQNLDVPVTAPGSPSQRLGSQPTVQGTTAPSACSSLSEPGGVSKPSEPKASHCPHGLSWGRKIPWRDPLLQTGAFGNKVKTVDPTPEGMHTAPGRRQGGWIGSFWGDRGPNVGMNGAEVGERVATGRSWWRPMWRRRPRWEEAPRGSPAPQPPCCARSSFRSPPGMLGGSVQLPARKQRPPPGAHGAGALTRLSLPRTPGCRRLLASDAG